MAVTDGLTPNQRDLFDKLTEAMTADGTALADQSITPSIAGTDDPFGGRFRLTEPSTDVATPPATSDAGGEGGTAADQPSPQPSPDPSAPDMRDLISRHTGADADDDTSTIDDTDDGLVIIDEDPDSDEAVATGGTPDGTEPSAPSPPGVDLGAVWESHYGHQPSVDEVVDFLGTVDSINQASPQQRYLIAQILAGYDPSTQPSPLSSPAGTPAPQAPPSSPGGPATSFEPIPIDEYADESTKRMVAAANAQLAATNERLAAYEANTIAQQQAAANAQLEARNQLIRVGVQEGRSKFYAEHPGFTPTQQVILERHAQTDGRFGVMLQLDPVTQMPRADVVEATKKFYNLLVSERPELAAVITNTATATAEQATKDATRKRKSTSVSGRSAAIPSTRATGGRLKGMAGLKEELDRIFQGGAVEE
jgi:hypothetical protein